MFVFLTKDSVKVIPCVSIKGEISKAKNRNVHNKNIK